MPRILEISSCNECPHCEWSEGRDDFYCIIHDHDWKELDTLSDIPSWCPLPEKSSASSCASQLRKWAADNHKFFDDDVRMGLLQLADNMESSDANPTKPL